MFYFQMNVFYPYNILPNAKVKHRISRMRAFNNTILFILFWRDE